MEISELKKNSERERERERKKTVRKGEKCECNLFAAISHSSMAGTQWLKKKEDRHWVSARE